MSGVTRNVAPLIALAAMAAEGGSNVVRPAAALALLALVACSDAPEPFGLDVDSRVVESMAARTAQSATPAADEITIVACTFAEITSPPGPVLVVDGVVLSADRAGTLDLSPDEIEGVTILKGRQATDRFGERAAENGAILIRTRSAVQATIAGPAS